MKLTNRQRNDRRARTPRIALSQHEIDADLRYPAASRRVGRALEAARRIEPR